MTKCVENVLSKIWPLLLAALLVAAASGCVATVETTPEGDRAVIIETAPEIAPLVDSVIPEVVKETVEDVAGAVADVVAERPEVVSKVMEDVAEGDITGLLITGGSALALIWGGLIYRKRRRRARAAK